MSRIMRLVAITMVSLPLLGLTACGSPCDQVKNDQDMVSITQRAYDDVMANPDPDATDALIALQNLNDANSQLTADQAACDSSGDPSPPQ
jgi:hypothetical protein